MLSLAHPWIAVGALVGAAGVGLGAFGAHGLAEALQSLGYEGDDLARRLANFETAARYQMYHALALVLIGLLLYERPSRAWNVAAMLFLAGVALFSGLLYVLVFTGPAWKWLGAVVPFGGLSLVVAWLALAVGSLRG
jgi:uncharacterized membrane protein YgdD (TMEM256/DUF423 family)